MTHAVLHTYARGLALVKTRPWLIAIPVLAELAQHAVEIRVGMYRHQMDATGAAVRLGLGIVKILAILATLIIAWRLWRFHGHAARALRPSAALMKGVGLFLLVQITADGAALLIGRGLIALAGDAARSTRIVLTLLPMLVWLLASATLFPWYVALATEDRTMTLRRAVRASRNRLPAIWGLLFAGFLPLMIVHYALGYTALRGVVPAWPLMIVDAPVVGLLTAVLAATYFTVYEHALERPDSSI